MPAPSNVRKNFNLFLDGIGYAGNVDEFTPPTLTEMLEDFRGGGLDAPIGVSMGMEKLSCTFTITKITPECVRLWGLATVTTPLIVKGALEDDAGNVRAEEFRLRGKIPVLEFAAIAAGTKSALTFTLEPIEYAYTIDGTQVFDIDVPNMKRVINGVDQLAAQRAALGLA